MEHKMSVKVRELFEKDTWYRDIEGDFHKFKCFAGDDIINYSATVLNKKYIKENSCFGVGYFGNLCIPMTITEMKMYLPEEEWWVIPSNDLFPIY